MRGSKRLSMNRWFVARDLYHDGVSKDESSLTGTSGTAGGIRFGSTSFPITVRKRSNGTGGAADLTSGAFAGWGGRSSATGVMRSSGTWPGAVEHVKALLDASHTQDGNTRHAADGEGDLRRRRRNA